MHTFQINTLLRFLTSSAIYNIMCSSLGRLNTQFLYVVIFMHLCKHLAGGILCSNTPFHLQTHKNCL